MMVSAPLTAPSTLTGYLLVNKPSGPTSFDLIRWLRRTHKKLKVGHSGTLDPLASGLMILLIGKATKVQDRFMKLDKTYLCQVRLGKRTDTADRMGKVVEEKIVPTINSTDLENALKEFVGPQNQMPPMFAAIKKDGVPLYKLARKGEVVERTARAIQIYSMELIGQDGNDLFTFRVRCSSGTYVRTLAEDVAIRLGTLGTVESLVREEIGPYKLVDAVPGETLQTLDESGLSLLLKEIVA
jgi:tRNA pseudouridine55 synthase